MNGLDRALFQLMNGFAGVNPGIDFIIVFAAAILPFLIAAAVAAFPFTVMESREKTVWAKVEGLLFAFLWASIARFIVTPVIRFLLPNPRPFVSEGFTPLIPHEMSSSFPSGHAVFFFALAMTMWFYHRPLAYILGGLALLVSLARIVAGLHWPSDVLAGAVLGIVVAIIGDRIQRKMARRGSPRS